MRKRVVVFTVILCLLLVNAMSAAASYVSDQDGKTAAPEEETILLPGDNTSAFEQADYGAYTETSEDPDDDLADDLADDLVDDLTDDLADDLVDDLSSQGSVDVYAGETGETGQIAPGGYSTQADSLEGDEFAVQADPAEGDEFSGQADYAEGDELLGQEDSMAEDESAGQSGTSEGDLSQEFERTDDSGLFDGNEAIAIDENDSSLPEEAGSGDEMSPAQDPDDQENAGNETDPPAEFTADESGETVSSDESVTDAAPGQEEMSDADSEELTNGDAEEPVSDTAQPQEEPVSEEGAAAYEQEPAEEPGQTDAVEEIPSFGTEAGTEEEPASSQDGTESGVQEPETGSADSLTEQVPEGQAQSNLPVEEEDQAQALSSTEAGMVTVSWTQEQGVDGYQIQCCSREDFDFAGGAAGISDKVEGSGSETKTLSNLTSGKVYYVRIRSYRGADEIIDQSDWKNLGEITVK